MYRLRRSYDFAIVAESTREGGLFCLLQALLPFAKIPVFSYECLWDPPAGRFKRWLFGRYIRVLCRVCFGFVIFSEVDRHAYAKHLPIPLEKLYAVPYCTTLSRYNLAITDENYIFAGGDSLRDYGQLLDAVANLPYRVIIATNITEQFRNRKMGQNVSVRSTTDEEFRKLMAAASLHVVPLAHGFLRSVGHQTYLNGMALGKPVLVTDRAGTREYIDDGVDGVTVAPGDVQGLRSWIVTLMENPQLRASIGQRARIKTASFSGSKHLEKLLQTAIDAFRKQRPLRS